MTPSTPPCAEFEITPEDWEEVNAAHIFASSLYREAAGKVRILTALLLVTLAILTWTLGSPATAVAFLMLGVPLVAGIGPLVRHAQRSSLRRMGRQGIGAGTFGRHRVEVRPEGLLHTTHAFETLRRWHAIDRVEQSGDYFLIYLGPNAFLPVPATAFRDAGALRRFADAFQRNLAAAEIGPTGVAGAGVGPTGMAGAEIRRPT